MTINEWKWTSRDGLEMYARSWTPEEQPKAVVCLIHGHGEQVIHRPRRRLPGERGQRQLQFVQPSAGPDRKPTFVAMTTSLRRDLSARPSSVSDSPPA